VQLAHQFDRLDQILRQNRGGAAPDVKFTEAKTRIRRPQNFLAQRSKIGLSAIPFELDAMKCAKRAKDDAKRYVEV
jgi:hypothetical protein